MSVEVKVTERGLEAALKKFKSKLQRERVFSDIRKNRYYRSKSQERRKKQHISFLRNLKKKKKELDDEK